MGERGWGGDVGERGRVGSEVGEGRGEGGISYYNRYVQ